MSTWTPGIPIVILLLHCMGCAEKNDPPRTKPDAAGGELTPERAVTMLFSAGKQGDVRAYTRLLGGISAARFRFVCAHISLDDAVHARFGQRLFPQDHITRSAADRIRDRYAGLSLELRGSRELAKDRVLVTVWLRGERLLEETWMTVRHAGRWKVVLPGLGKVRREERELEDGSKRRIFVLERHGLTRDGPREVEEWNRDAEFLKRMADDVKQGRLGSLNEVRRKIARFRSR